MTEFAISVRDMGLERLSQHRQAQQSVSRRLTSISEKIAEVSLLISQLRVSRNQRSEMDDVESRIAPIISVIKQQTNLRSKLSRIDAQLDAVITTLREMNGQ
jgi:hypothetical protein